MTRLAGAWQRILKPSGSLVVNLGPVCYSGRPVQSPYIERLTLALIDELGYRLADRLYWHNPAKLPTPMPWVAVRRVRLKPSVEPVLWFSKGDHPRADNRAVLLPYRERDRWMGKEKAGIGPSRHDFSERSFAKDNGGAIPGTLLSAATGQSKDAYRRACRREGIAIHPATWPEALPDFLIRFLTREGDLVYDPFLGSGTTGAAAERLGRRWIGSERSKTFLDGARLRFAPASDAGGASP